MADPIELIVGLGNPGSEYEQTRHNAGAWLVNMLAAQHNQALRQENKFLGATAKIDSLECRILIPSTYMNHSGQAVRAIANFYRIPPEKILIVHDELDLPSGTARFKQGGGDGGHNGLKDINFQLGNKNYWRLRLGIGHPGNKHDVVDYVLKKPSVADKNLIMTAIEDALTVFPQFIAGEQQKAIQALHTKEN